MKTNKKDILVPIVTPFNEDETVNYEALAALTKKVIAEGAHGIYAVGSSAECFMLSTEERKKCLEVIIEAADGAFVVAHVGDISVKKTIELAQHAEKAGADVVASVPPFYFGFNFACVKSYYEALAASVKIPTLVYNLPGSTGVSMNADQLAELLAIPGVDYMKYTDADYFVMEQAMTKSGKYFYSGKDECFLSAISAGANGGIGTTYNVMVGKYLRIQQLHKEGKMEEALRVQKSANAITACLIKNGCLASVKYVLELQGIKAGNARRPFLKLTDEQKAEVKAVYEANINI